MLGKEAEIGGVSFLVLQKDPPNGDTWYAMDRPDFVVGASLTIEVEGATYTIAAIHRRNDGTTKLLLEFDHG